MSYKDAILAKIEELGEAAPDYFGVSKQTIAAWKNGRADALISAIEKIAPKGQTEEPMDIEAHDGSTPLECEPMLWQDKNLIILMPSYKETNPYTAFSVFALHAAHMGKVGIDMEVRTMVHKARNRLLTRFMRIPHKPQWALFIDDDMIIPCGKAAMMRERFNMQGPDSILSVDAIKQLTSRGKTLIGGLYFGRGKNAPAMYAEALNKANMDVYKRENADAQTAPKDVVKKTYGVATGCMLIHRSCVEAIERKFPEIVSKDPRKDNGYFTPQDHLEGEDMAFCRRAAAAGHPAYVDYSVVCGHLGQRIYWPHNINS